jgi:hypothetical protein
MWPQQWIYMQQKRNSWKWCFLCSPYDVIYIRITYWTGGTVVPPDTRFPFCHLLLGPGPPGWGSLESETVKYGHESCGTETWEWLYWQGPASIVNGKPIITNPPSSTHDSILQVQKYEFRDLFLFTFSTKTDFHHLIVSILRLLTHLVSACGRWICYKCQFWLKVQVLREEFLLIVNLNVSVTLFLRNVGEKKYCIILDISCSGSMLHSLLFKIHLPLVFEMVSSFDVFQPPFLSSFCFTMYAKVFYLILSCSVFIQSWTSKLWW